MSATITIQETGTTLQVADSLSISTTQTVTQNVTTVDLTEGEFLNMILAVDGAGSGIDADTLDGNEATAFEDNLSTPGGNGYVLTSTTGGTRSWTAIADVTGFQAAVEEAMLADATAHATRSTSGDGTAVIAAPGAGSYIHILGGALTVDDPGTDTVTIVIKSGSTAKYEVTLDAEAVGIAMMPQIVCGTNEAVYVNLSDAVNVNYTLSYKTRSA